MADDFPADVMNEILDMLQRGEKLQAIKRYIDERGVGLAEAKAFIDQLSSKIKVNNNSQGDAESEVDSETLDFIYSGQKIEAVKRYREQHGTTLLDAKVAIEQLMVRLKEQNPERFTVTKKAGGCAAIVIFFAAIVVSSAAHAFCRIAS